MKNRFFLGLIGVLLVFGFLAVSCDNGNNGNTDNGGNDPDLVGTWNSDTRTGLSLVFTADKVNVTSVGDLSYTANNGSITIKSTGQTISGSYDISGTTLTLTNFPTQNQLNDTYTKQNGNTAIDNDSRLVGKIFIIKGEVFVFDKDNVLINQQPYPYTADGETLNIPSKNLSYAYSLSGNEITLNDGNETITAESLPSDNIPKSFVLKNMPDGEYFFMLGKLTTYENMETLVAIAGNICSI
jgi:hypothetical protein